MTVIFLLRFSGNHVFTLRMFRVDKIKNFKTHFIFQWALLNFKVKHLITLCSPIEPYHFSGRFYLFRPENINFFKYKCPRLCLCRPTLLLGEKYLR